MLLLLNRKRFNPRSLPNLQLWLPADRIGVQGYSLDFDGTNDEGEATNVITAYPFTMECWFNKDANERTIMGLYDTTVNNKMFRLRIGTTGKIILTGQNTTEQSTIGTTDINNGIWTHVAAVYASETDRKLYVNGILDNDSNTNSVTFPACSKVGFGVRLTTSKIFYDGKLSDVRIWNTARTAQQIADNYQKRLIGNESGLVGYWKLDKGSGTTVADSTTNANAGTITGAVWDNSEPFTEPIDDGTAVRIWADQSGNGYDATQSTTAARPTYIVSGLNGLPVVRFDGTDDRLALGASALGMLRNVAGATVFVVVKYSTVANNPAFLISTTSATSPRFLLRSSTTPRFQIVSRRLDADSTVTISSAQSVPTSSFFIHSSIADFQNTLLQQFINGVKDGENTSFGTSGNTSDTDSNNITIGLLSVTYFTGDIAEIIVYNRALNTSELAQVHRYLSRKWGIALA
jgi:hypothetical protein